MPWKERVQSIFSEEASGEMGGLSARPVLAMLGVVGDDVVEVVEDVVVEVEGDGEEGVDLGVFGVCVGRGVGLLAGVEVEVEVVD